jgi:hypothetical protein
MYLYGGLSGVQLPVASFPLGEGVELRQTYSHLFSTNMMAFARPGAAGHHPTPWKAARGGFSYDIEVEIRAPYSTSLGKDFDAKEIIWWIAALLRLVRFPYLSVPVISNLSFTEIATSKDEPELRPFETEGRLFSPSPATDRVLDVAGLEWVAANWVPAGKLLSSSAKFYSALKAFDAAPVRGRASASLLALWGGLEQLFAPSAGELRFRVAALLSSYLEKPGTARMERYKEVLKLYNERSMAAHTANEVEVEPLVQTYVLMRNALMQMIQERRVPSQTDLEALLFCIDESGVAADGGM